MQKSWKLFTRKFAYTWIPHRETKFANILQNYSPSGYKQFLKISDQLVVKYLYSNSSKFRFLLKFTKNGQIDDVIKALWRNQRKFKHSLLHPPIDDLLDMGSEDVHLFICLKLRSSQLVHLQRWSPQKSGIFKHNYFDEGASLRTFKIHG